MCLEDEAQRNALLRKQEGVLNVDQALDAGDEDITSMSEPDLLWLLLSVLGWILIAAKERLNILSSRERTDFGRACNALGYLG